MSHQDRRDPLPADYQFGDAGWNVIEGEPFPSDSDQHRTAEGFIVDHDCGDETPWAV